MENATKSITILKKLLSKEQFDKIEKHLDIFLKWKEIHNLTSIENKSDVYKEHYLDSVLGLRAIEPLVQKSESVIYDFGSGAGFPGLIAAVLWPNKDIFLVESSRKKSSFLKLSSSLMELNRVFVVEKRVEDLRGEVSFAITRAAFSAKNWFLLKKAMAPQGRVAFWLSASVESENPDWVLERREYYELEPKHKRQIAVFHVKPQPNG